MRNILVSLFISFSLLAQAEESNYNYGVEGGVNLSNITSSAAGASDLYNRLGVVGGLYWDLFPKQRLSFVPGGYIVGKGYRPTTSTSVVLNYVQLRALGRLSLFQSSKSKLFIDFGASADVITQKGTQNFSNPPQMTDFKNFDVSLLGGLGFETDISDNTRLVFNVKYLSGLLDLTQNDTVSIKSQGILVTTAIQFSTEDDKVIPTEDRAREFLNRSSNP